jgi:hypothetical protein
MAQIANDNQLGKPYINGEKHLVIMYKNCERKISMASILRDLLITDSSFGAPTETENPGQSILKLFRNIKKDITTEITAKGGSNSDVTDAIQKFNLSLINMVIESGHIEHYLQDESLVSIAV